MFLGYLGSFFGKPLGYLMWLGYRLFNNYCLAILFFTVITKIIMLPISLLVQKNSIKMIKMKPRLDELRYQYIDDKDEYLDAQSRLYKEERYSPLSGLLPLFIQIPLIFGLINVVYNPLEHILHLPQDVINAFIMKASEILGTSDLGSSPQLRIVDLLRSPELIPRFQELSASISSVDIDHVISDIRSIDMDLFGINLASIPSITSFDILWLIPLLAGLSAFLMCAEQNRINVLQMEESKLSQWGMTLFLIAFSTYFAFIVPAGVGLYWVFANLLSIPVMYLVNAIYNPKKYIDYSALERIKANAAAEREQKKKHRKLAKKYYKKFFADGNSKNMKLMFYSEQSGFYKYFEAIIDNILSLSDLTVHYVTSDPNDKIFEKTDPRIVPYFIDETRLIPLMMKTEADIVVMTAPDLDKYHIKRSKVRSDVEYVFVDHGCGSDNLAYRTGALDNYDTILAIGPNQVNELRAIERLRGTKKKAMVKCGYGLIDNMIRQYEALGEHKNEKPTILIAPSWQYDNIMDSCLDGILDSLLGKEFRIIVRPHPQYVRRFPTRMETIMLKYSGRFNEDFVIETDFSSNVTVFTADMVITDWSSIAYEFSLTTCKPTLYINTEMKVVNKQYQRIGIVPVDISLRNQIGRTIEKDEVSEIDAVIRQLLKDQPSYRENIRQIRESLIYNLRHSGEAGARYIISRLSAHKRPD